MTHNPLLVNLYPVTDDILTFKAPVTTAADDILILFLKKIRLNISCESSDQTDNLHEMSDLIVSEKKNNVKELECRLLQICLAL